MRWILLLVVLASFCAFGQDTACITVNISDFDQEPIYNTRSYILQGDDTIATVKLDNQVRFEITIPVEGDGKYKIHCYHIGKLYEEQEFMYSSSLAPMHYVFDFHFYAPPCTLGKVPLPQYKFMETDVPEDYDWSYLKYLIETHETACFQIMHATRPEESEEIGKERLNKFKTFLDQKEIPTNRITINYKYTQLRDHHYLGARRSRLEGSVISNDCE